MNSIDLTSLLLGIVATIMGSVIVYFITRVWLFKNIIIIPEEYNQNSESIELVDSDLRWASYLNTYVRVRGWEPSRDVVFFINHPFEKAKISPNVPFEILENEIKIGALSPGTYQISLSGKGADCHTAPTITAVESSNSQSKQRRLLDPKFESIFTYAWPGITTVALFAVANLLIDLFQKFVEKP